MMDRSRHIWRVWSETLQQWGVQELVASLLEASGPLALLGAQAVYLGEPLLRGLLPAGHLPALANLLEKPEETRAFVSYLREANQP